MKVAHFSLETKSCFGVVDTAFLTSGCMCFLSPNQPCQSTERIHYYQSLCPFV